LESSDESVAKFSKVNGKLSIVGAGKTTITASQLANDDFLASSKNFVLTVRKGTPVLTATADLSSTFGENGPTIAKPTSESRGAISFASSNAAVATVNATTGQVTVVGAGTSTITITQAATDDYVSATQTLTFTVKQAVPSLGKLTTESKKFGDAEFSIEKPTSPSTGTFTFTSSDSKVVKISEAGKATVEGAGKTTITATQAAAGNYAANSVTAEVTIAKAAPELSNVSLTGLVFGDADTTMDPRSTSSGAFTFSSNNTRVLTISEKTGLVRIVGAGTATITVKQASTTNYESASSSVTVQVGHATPAFQRLDPLEKIFGDASFLFNWGTSPSDGDITYTSSNPTVATIDSTTGRVTIVSTGVTTLTMSQAKGTNHTAATTVAVLTVGRGTPVYGDFVVANKTYGAAAFLPTLPTTTSSGAFTFTSSNTSVATVNSTTGLVTVVAPGSTEIAATQAQTLTHTASTIRTTFVVDPASPVISAMPAITKAYGSAAFTLTAPTSNSSGAISYTSSNTAVATIDSNTRLITLTGAGTTTITASQAATSTYTSAGTSTTLTVENAPEITQLSLSNVSSCGLTSTGAMKCWGSNNYGQIGTLASNQQKTPIDVPGFTNNISAIAVGDSRMCALTTTGEVKCIGNGVADSNNSGISTGAISISSGYANSCALMSTGGVKCWGDNWTGQLGSGTWVNTSPAVDVKGLTSGVTAITSGIQFSCALLSGGSVKCWGANNYGQLGDGTTTNRNVPTPVVSLGTTIRSISGGLNHTCAITTGGAAKCWGYNALGSLGNGTFTDSLIPVNVVGLDSGVLSIEASKSFATCARVTGTSVKCWGHSWAGNVGDGSTTDRSSPVNVVGLMSSSPSATTLGALTLPSSSYTTTSPDFTLSAPTSSRPGTITFASSNTAVATVDAATGLVQIKGTGTAVLAAAIGGNGQYRAASAQVTITVGS
jgi:uncharacterized protein YjdB